MNSTKGSKNFENLNFDHGYTINISYNHCPKFFHSHWHSYAEIVYLLGDEITYTVNGSSFLLNKGDILFIWPGELHSLLKNKEPELLICQFDSILLDTIHALCKNQFIILQHLRIFHYSDNTSLCKTTGAHLKRLKNICIDIGLKDPFCDMHMCIELFYLFIDLFQAQSKKQPEQTNKNPVFSDETIQKITAACNFIHNNFSRDIDLESTASYIGFSKYHFSRLFKEYTGISFLDYVTQHRLHYAEGLLGNPCINITDVALQSGFGSISTFNRIFRQYKDCSPSEFRQMFRAP